MKTIEIDCAPGTARPDSYIREVVAGTVLESKLTEPVSKVFGNWEWAFDIPDDEYPKELIKQRITALYNSGYIRYGSW